VDGCDRSRFSDGVLMSMHLLSYTYSNDIERLFFPAEASYYGFHGLQVAGGNIQEGEVLGLIDDPRHTVSSNLEAIMTQD
jgi:hypothetical protein